jgi:hypothetical protein
MVSAIEFAVRDVAGGTQRGMVAGEGQANFIQVGSGDSVSLNLSQASVAGYEQRGRDLVVKLIDGREITLTGYFDAAAGDTNHLYLSSDGMISEVFVTGNADGTLFANYGPVQGWDKWSPIDDLRMVSADPVASGVAIADERVGMAPFIPGLLAGGGGVGAAAAIGGGALLVGGLGSGGGSGSGGGRTPPTVDPQSKGTVTTNTTNPSLPVSGTGVPGDKVDVTVGGRTQTTTIGTDGTWSVRFPATNMPADGTHTATVVVTPPNLPPINLTGPIFLIDLTPPPIVAETGTKSVGHVENKDAYADGVTISGSSEAGATIRVQIGTHTQTTTVGANGKWSVNFTQTQVQGGEYEVPVSITATDINGNVTVKTETLVVDTVPHPISFDSVTGDNRVNLIESQSGLTVTGSSTPGARLDVSLQGVTKTVTTGADGRWSATYPTGTLPAGEYQATLTATTTDAAGNRSSASHNFQVDTTTAVAFTGQVAGDNIVNATEAAGGVTMTGTAQVGSTVSVAWNGATLPATVGANGTWSVNFPASGIPAGTYSATATVTATDAFGNTDRATREIRVDTETRVTVNPGQLGGDDVANGTEAGAGVALTGTAEAGASVAVTMEGVTRTVTAGSDGRWTANFAASEIRQGTYASTVSVRATDAAGNTASNTHNVNVDTEVRPFARSTLSTGADNILNAAEAASGLTVTGTVEPGSSVRVTFGTGQSRSATVDANGNWSLTVPASEVPAGENTVRLTANATDRFGNTSSISENVQVDTRVLNFQRTGDARLGGDGFLNAAETAAGLTMTGTSEPGSTILLRLSNGSEGNVNVGANGSWSYTFASSALPKGEGNASVTVTATDRVGNVANFTENFSFDTVAPTAPRVTADMGNVNNLNGIATAQSASNLAYYEVNETGAANRLTVQSEFNLNVNVDGVTLPSKYAVFSRDVPDGSYLVIRDVDTAGNEASTMYLRNTTETVAVDLNRTGLQNFDFGTIDLSAADATLSISEATINRIAGVDKTLTVKGDDGDVVTITSNAVFKSNITGTDGETYKIYTLGTGGATLLVDDDITLNTTGV